MLNNVIVVPIDGSPSSLKALSFAIEHAVVFHGKIILLNIQAKFVDLQRDHYIDEDEISRLQREKGLAVMNKAIAKLNEKNIPFEAKVRIGIATIEITSEAKEQGAKMIVLGSRGNGPVVSAALGSVSYGVLHLATCPVTIVPLGS